MRELAAKASESAHAPYSNYQVGCCVLTEKGNFYTGCNVEEATFNTSPCAEVVAVSSAIVKNDKELKAIYVYSGSASAPCGGCRQFLTEFADRQLPIFAGSPDGSEKSFTLAEIFPHSYSVKDFEDELKSR